MAWAPHQRNMALGRHPALGRPTAWRRQEGMIPGLLEVERAAIQARAEVATAAAQAHPGEPARHAASASHAQARSAALAGLPASRAVRTADRAQQTLPEAATSPRHVAG